MDEQPARALGHVAADDEDADRRGWRRGRRPAASRAGRAMIVGLSSGDGEQRAGGRADPERAVDRQVDAAAVLGGDQLVDRGVDGGVLAADAGAGEEPGRRSTRGSARRP